MTRQDVAEILRQYAILLDLLDTDPFRAKAYDGAARALELQPESLDTLIAGNRLSAIRGIGKGVAATILEIAERGTFVDYEETLEKIPPGIFDLLRIEGLGPKKARTLWREANITSLETLREALDQNRIAGLSGFGAKSAEKIRAGLEFLSAVSGRHWRHHAERAAQSLTGALSRQDGVQDVFIGGSYRRGCETIGDLDILIIADSRVHAELKAAILALPNIKWGDTGTILRGETINGFPIELSLAAPSQAAAYKIVATGSKSHVAELKRIAGSRGISWDVDGPDMAAASEAEIYDQLGLEYVPPALRESADTVVPKGSHSFPAPLELSQIRGILHCHTTYSDGHHSLREMAEAMIARGYEYIGIADHSQSAAYAKGLSPQRVREQWEEIDRLNSELAPFRILKGTESDILSDGRLDFEDELLAGFDFVVASIHSGFNMTEEQATDRLCQALANPHVDILGHPTGRLLLERNGYPVNHKRLIECAAENCKAIELNCNPHRLDLDWRWLEQCEKAGVPVPLCPDAHQIEGLWEIRFGIELAAKGPLTSRNCPSTWTAEEFKAWCQSHD